MPSVGVARADLDALMPVLGSFAQFRELDALRRHTVAVMTTLMPGNAVGWNEVDAERSRIVAVTEPDLYSEEAAATFMEHIGEHPLITRFDATGDGRPYAISDFLSESAFHATGLYQNFYRMLDAEDQIAFILPEPRVIIGIAINRPARGFTREERQVLNALRPHIIQAYRNAEDFSRLQRSVTAMQVLVEQAGEGLVLTDRHGDLEFCSELAQDMLGRWFGPIENGQLPEPVRGWLGRSVRPSSPPTPLHVDHGDARLMVRRLPVPDGHALLVSETRGGQTAELLRRLGLTGREVEVLLALTSGHTIANTAGQLGVSPRTVEKHVEHIYDKLGLDGRVAATNLVRQLEHRRV